MQPQSYDPDTARALRLFIALTRCANAVTGRVRANAAAHGLSATELGVLEMLYHKGPLSLGDISERILLQSGSLTYVVNQLVKAGLVARRRSPEDRRVIFAELTPSGIMQISKIFPDHAAAICSALAGLGPDDQEQAAGLLSRLGRAAQRSDTKRGADE